MNHDFADVKAIMSETGKVHLGTGIAEGEDRINSATDRAISNPLLENNTISGAKGVLINISCGNDTSLHEVETAVSKVKEEVDINANLIWGIQQDDKLDGKFRISVIATGIESESYYQNLIDSNNSNESIINEFSTNQINDINQNQTESAIQENKEQRKGFIINLQESKKSIDEDLKAQEKIIQDDNLKVNKKTSIFSNISKLFGKKNNKEIKIEENKVNFFEEIREISEKNETENTNTTNNQVSDTHLSENNIPKFNDSSNSHADENVDDEIKNSEELSNEINDDLLQIPAFLRRQAN